MMRSVCCSLFAAALATAATAGGTISGSVVDAATGAPIGRATVTLTPTDGLGILSGARTAASSLAMARTTATSATGSYKFTELPIGAYRLYVQRIGYAAATIDVRLGDTGTSPLSIGLVVVPVRLRAVEVRALDVSSTAADRSAAMTDAARIAAARARQRAFLSTDVREITPGDVAESATLGGSDIFRALERLPGVTQFDDWSAKLWVRDNRWDHNRVYYDDLPLFDPLQALGQASGVSADAIGAAFLHPGVRPVSLGGEGATRIDLRSRPADGGGDWHGSAQLSRFGAAGSIERERVDSSAGFAATGQHTLGALGDRSVSDAQATLRGDVDFGGGRRLETSGIVSRDAHVFRDAGAYGPGQDWGNAAARVTVRAPLGPIATSHTFGVSHFASRSNRTFVPIALDDVTVHPVESSVDYLTLGGRASLNATVVGYDVVTQRSSFDGARSSIYWGDLSEDHASRRDALSYASAWADRRVQFGDRLSVETGLRMDFGAAAQPAGSVQGRFALSPRTWLSIGASRAHQYVQALDLPIVARGQTAPTLWLTSGSDVPAMSIDNAMAGVERWMGGTTLVAANVYVRHTSGAITDDPTPGPLAQRPLFVSATESARGVELSARKLAGRITGLVAYSYARATMDAVGLVFTAPASRPRAFDAALAVHGGGFTLGGAYTRTSGAPFTRTVYDLSNVAVRDAPNAERLPYYASLDVSLDYARGIYGKALIAFAGMENVLGRTNPTWYQISGLDDHDVVSAPVKFAPTAGLRLLF